MASISASDRAALMKLNEDARKAKAKFAETDAKLAYRTNFRQRNLLTKREVEAAPDGVKLYKGVGRMFVLSDKETLKNELDANVKRTEEEMEKFKKELEYHRKQKDKLAKELEETVKHHQSN